MDRTTQPRFVVAVGLVSALVLLSACKGEPIAGFPDPPQRLSSVDVAINFDAARASSDQDVEFLIGKLAVAGSRRALMQFAAEALHAIQALPPDEQPEWRLRVSRAIRDARGRVNVIAIPTARDRDATLLGCSVNFNDHDILDGLILDGNLDQPSTFLFEPWWTQLCGVAGWVHVEPTKFSHYHLSYEDPTIDCLDMNGDLGRSDNGGCIELDDPGAEPRKLGTHDGREIIAIWVGYLFWPDVPMPFDMLSFDNLGADVKFSYRKADSQQWFTWPSMGGNLTWNVSAYVTDVDRVLITNAGTSLNCGPDWEAAQPGDCPVGLMPFFLDNFHIIPKP